MEKYDVIIVGAGVVGGMIARTLSKYNISILVIEKESDVCMGTSSANTAIIHAGYDPVPGTIKAELNVKGNRMWDTLAGELSIPFKRTGDYVVAANIDEFKKLEELKERGNKMVCLGLKLFLKMHFFQSFHTSIRLYQLHSLHPQVVSLTHSKQH